MREKNDSASFVQAAPSRYSVLVIDALGQIARVQRVPMRRFVCVNG